MWILKNIVLKNQWVNENILKIRKYCEINENANTIFKQSMGCSKSISKRESHSNVGLSQKTIKISNKQPNIPFKRI